MKEEKYNLILKAISVPIMVIAFLPVWLIVSSVNIYIIPDPRILIGSIYASVLTLSILYFGLKLRSISK